jgi:hypothetical protein
MRIASPFLLSCLVLDQRMDQHILPTSLKLEKTAEPHHRFRRRGAEPAQSSLCSPAHRFHGQVTVAERFRRGPKAVEVRGGAHVVFRVPVGDVPVLSGRLASFRALESANGPVCRSSSSPCVVCGQWPLPGPSNSWPSRLPQLYMATPHPSNLKVRCSTRTFRSLG